MKILPFLLLFLLFSFCSKKATESRVDPSAIVAIVADDTVFVNDLIRRCEFTVRPIYCQQDGIQDKRICLNSLIAEKLFALEAGEDNPLTGNEKFRARLQGIKEQLMREELIRDQVVDKIEIPEEEVRQAYLNSRKTVHTEAVFIPASYDADAIYRDARQGTPLQKLSEKYPGVSGVVKRDVKWGHIDEEAQNAIFNDKVTRGTVLAPLAMKDGYRLIKVTGWTEQVELSPANRDLQMQNIRSKLRDYYIRKYYKEFAQSLMRGKRIDFFEKGWQVVVATLQQAYVPKGEADNLPEIPMSRLEPLYDHLADNGDLPFMQVDGKIWTIDDFRQAMLVHPLEISQKSLTKENFTNRLQAAIAGLVTDQYLTRLAYEKKYDKSHTVNRLVKEWKNYYLFLYQRDQYLARRGFKGKIARDYFEAFDNYLTPYFDSLKVKYDQYIRFNPAALDSLQLTRIPMIAYKTKGPYTPVVPPFPLVTNSHKTNYKRLPTALQQ